MGSSPRWGHRAVARLRTWADATPNGRPALAMIAVGVVLIVAALVLVAAVS